MASADSSAPGGANIDTMSISELKAAIQRLVGPKAFAALKFVEKAEMRRYLREQREARAMEKEGVHVVPAGRYILGDPCYLSRDVHALELFQKTYYDPEEEEDEEEDEEEEDRGRPRFDDNTPVVAFNTARADRGPAWFTDREEKMSVRINGGVIALCALAYNPDFTREGDVAREISFDEPTRCWAKKGIVHFGEDIVFNTNRPIPVEEVEAAEDRAEAKKARARQAEASKAEEQPRASRRRRRDEPSPAKAKEDDDDDEAWEPPRAAKRPRGKKKSGGGAKKQTAEQEKEEEEDEKTEQDDDEEVEFEFD